MTDGRSNVSRYTTDSQAVEFNHDSAIRLACGGEFLVELRYTGSEVDELRLWCSRSSWSAAVAVGAPRPLRSNACRPNISESLSSRARIRWDSHSCPQLKR
jgi:hypothetical protein